MSSYRVVVASIDRAEIYDLPDPRGALEHIVSLANPAAHKRSHDLGTDAPGRVAGGGGSVRHAYQPRHTLKEGATEQFVRSVIEGLVGEYAAKPGADIILIASPRLMAQYKRLAPRALAARFAVEVPRDLVKSPKAVLETKIRSALARP